MLISVKREYKQQKIERSVDVYMILRELLYSKHRFDYEKEHFYTVLISRNNRIKFIDEVSIGNLNSTIVSAREVFRFAVLKGAEAIIVAHNHPSGNLTPSQQDRAVTDMLIESGKIIGIKVMDSLILTEREYFSFAENGLMDRF